MTQMVRAYFLDFRDEKVEQGTEAMLAMSLTREDMIGLAGATAVYESLADIQFGDVARFYEERRMNVDERAAKRTPVPKDLTDLPPVVGDEEAEEDEDAERNEGAG